MKTNFKIAVTVPIIQKILIVIAISLHISACEKFVEVAPPIDKQNRQQVFNDSSTVVSTIVGIYSEMANGTLTFGRHINLLSSLSADDLQALSSNADISFFENDILIDNTNLNNIWRLAYRHIYQANSIIEGLANSNGVSSSLKTRIAAEARFLRALIYFYLSNLYGKVPLITTTDYLKNQSMPRVSDAEIYTFITNELVAVAEDLSTDYISSDRVRPNKWTVQALLSRVYLYSDNWAKAEALANDIISSGLYTPLPPISAVFLKESNETIWQLFPANPGFNTPEGNLFIPSSASASPNYWLDSNFVKQFVSVDQRRSSWIKEQVAAGTKYYYPYKYKVRRGSSSVAASEYPIVFRLAEQYLIRAEARAQQNNIEGAINDIDQIRERAGLPLLSTTYPTISKADMLLEIEQQRRFEYFTEWGHRWFDLKRTSRADELLNMIKSPNWSKNDTLWPIPLPQLLANPFLSQNNGYPGR